MKRSSASSPWRAAMITPGRASRPRRSGRTVAKSGRETRPAKHTASQPAFLSSRMPRPSSAKARLVAGEVGQRRIGEALEPEHKERPAGFLAVGGEADRQGPAAGDQAELLHRPRAQSSRAGMVIGRPSSARMKSMISITSGEPA